MFSSILLYFIRNLRLDVAITFIFTVILLVVIIKRRSDKNKTLKRKKDILYWEDFVFSLVTSATFYGGLSAIYFSLTGRLLFGKNLIISEEYIILLAGFVLLGLAFITFRNHLKKIKVKKNEE